MSEATRTTYNEIIGYDADGNVVILLDTFVYPDGFKGATGAVLELVSQEEYDERTNDEAIKEHWREAWKEAVQANATELGLDDWLDDENLDPSEGILDESYREIVKAAGIEFVATNCIGGGRIFPSALSDATITHPDLVAAIYEVEGVTI